MAPIIAWEIPRGSILPLDGAGHMSIPYGQRVGLASGTSGGRPLGKQEDGQGRAWDIADRVQREVGRVEVESGHEYLVQLVEPGDQEARSGGEEPRAPRRAQRHGVDDGRGDSEGRILRDVRQPADREPEPRGLPDLALSGGRQDAHEPLLDSIRRVAGPLRALLGEEPDRKHDGRQGQHAYAQNGLHVLPPSLRR